MIKVAIVDDIKNIRASIVSKIKLSKDMEIVGEFSNGKEILHAIMQGLQADVLIMDIEMPVMDGIEATEKIISKYPDQKIVMCTVFDDENNLFRSICAGAKGYILKDEKPEKIHRYIFETMEGGSAMSTSMALKALKLIKTASVPVKAETNNISELSSRELEILSLISTGKSYEQVADHAGISYGTVRKHLENIYKKLNVHCKLEAVIKAQKEGLL
jgi:DNA-binding NarL/FixJ family response regulator